MMFKYSLRATTQVKFLASSLFSCSNTVKRSPSANEVCQAFESLCACRVYPVYMNFIVWTHYYGDSPQFTFSLLKGRPYQNNNKVDDLNCLARVSKLFDRS